MARMPSRAAAGSAPDVEPLPIARSDSATCAADVGRCPGSFRRQAPTSWSSAAGISGRMDCSEGAAVLKISNISASGRSLRNGRRPVAISKSSTPRA